MAFLIYYSPIILKGRLPEKYYTHLMKLVPLFCFLQNKKNKNKKTSASLIVRFLSFVSSKVFSIDFNFEKITLSVRLFQFLHFFLFLFLLYHCLDNFKKRYHIGLHSICGESTSMDNNIWRKEEKT